MKINLPDFLQFATYDGLIEPLNLQNYPKVLSSILEADSQKQFCIVDGYEVWTINGWIAEQKRIKRGDEILAEVRSRPAAKITDPMKLKGAIMNAILKNDLVLMKELQQQLIELTNEKIPNSNR